MRAEDRDIQARLAAWRACGADRFDGTRFRFIEALAARAARHDGRARTLIQARLAELMEAYDEALARAGAFERPDARAQASAGGPLAPLLGRLAAARRAQGAEDTEAMPPLPALAEFRRLWGELLGERRLRQSLAPQPADAGPLNSGVLVHRAIAHMRATSPEYLRHFLAYADHLCWLERFQARGAGVPQPAAARRTASRKRRG
ncbi:DUF2894 domain-containing protein [Stenotrophomonas sp. HITSZ_GD]|uniref:DUF2894 domain-containing protein n=1 Tax=Stenotrophomonas sp. HITSZ_GD TaxID=3037248 RepID=UPI00240CFAA9|nr:DUF2894 domain-containing protein [Stenotrophomonas sp. HITSZ_GD]MDG2523998.1 DUF2894 domain-containing protein [Stenotrophomonas sp. HITSZ_GD]